MGLKYSMQRQDFYYELPEELIAHYPAPERGESRLLVMDGCTGELEHCQFEDLLQLVTPGDVMVFNDTRVIPARMYGQKETGGKLEILVERVLNNSDVLVHIRSSKSPKAGALIQLDNGHSARVLGRQESLFELRFLGEESALQVMEEIGHMPLPPYIERDDESQDKERYQTVYGKQKGAVAAPTAGLHFSESMLNDLRLKGVQTVFVTLHVGAGTFQPVRVDDIREHKMHSEVMSVTPEVCETVNQAKAAGKQVIAVGTTSVRCLETAAQNVAEGEFISPYQGETNIFIYPSYQYRVVDALITNFHLPESTLIMLVSAFAGYEHTMHAYREAVQQKYRFFSYGDAMFISKRNNALNHEV